MRYRGRGEKGEGAEQFDIHPSSHPTNMSRAMVDLQSICKFFKTLPVGKWGRHLFPLNCADLSDSLVARRVQWKAGSEKTVQLSPGCLGTLLGGN